MEKINPETPDLTQENIDKIAELFPDVMTETQDADGNLVRAIDFEALKGDLSGKVVEGKKERYQFTWPGKAAAKLEARTPCDKTMRPCPEESVNWDTTQNLYIEGDNLEALKIMRETYAGKVKLIYIDPPYNTGHDFIYDDDFSKSRDDYEEASDEFDEEGGRLVANPESNGRFHSDWCSMMYPRLLLARDMLSNDGVIFISIDDNESRNLRNICDEVFGSENYLTDFIWEKRTTRENRRSVSVCHDHIHCYLKSMNEKDSAIGLLPMNESALSTYSNPDEDPRGVWTSVSTTAQAGHATKSQFYEFSLPSGKMVKPSAGNCWRYTKSRMLELVEDGRIWFGDKGDNFPRYKKFLSEGRQGLTPETILRAEEVGTTDSGKRELLRIFDNVETFETPKPSTLIQTLMDIGLPDGGLMLDFFSGSSTSADAALQYSFNTGKSVQMISIQIPEACKDGSSAGNNGFGTIADIGKDRIRRAGAKVTAAAVDFNRQLKLGEDSKPVPDIGFRVLKIDSSNYLNTYATPEAFAQDSLDTLIDNLKIDRASEDLLFQVMPKFRIPYSATIDKIDLCGKEVFDVNSGQLLACFDANVGVDTIEAIAKRKPVYAVLRDASLVDDSTAANFEELFKTFSPDTIRRVI